MRPAQWQGGKLPFKLLHTLSLLDKFKFQLSLLLTMLNKTKHSLICRHQINTAVLAFRKNLPLTSKLRFLPTWESYKLSQSLKHQDPISHGSLQKVTPFFKAVFNFFPKRAASEAADSKRSHKRLANNSILLFLLQFFFPSQDLLTFSETTHIHYERLPTLNICVSSVRAKLIYLDHVALWTVGMQTRIM